MSERKRTEALSEARRCFPLVEFSEVPTGVTNGGSTQPTAGRREAGNRELRIEVQVGEGKFYVRDIATSEVADFVEGLCVSLVRCYPQSQTFIVRITKL